jgi:phosphate transport system permease protein
MTEATLGGGSDPIKATPPTSPPRQRRSAAGSSSTWSWIDRLGLAFAWFLGLLFCAITAAIVIFLVIQGIRFLRPDMLWTNPKVSNTQSGSGGFLDPLLGTFIVAAIAIAIAGPVGTGVAVWLSEYARPAGLARAVESTVEMLAGAPTVVLALFGILLFESRILASASYTSGGVVFGKSFIAAGVILSLVALPYVVSSAREGLQGIPNHVREASYAVGKSKIATIRRVLLPAARPSVITGYMLGIGHVIGDTAIIVLLLGDTQTFQGVGHVPVLGMLRGTGSTLTSYVFDNAPTGDLNQPNKAYAAALVLLLIVVGLNLIVDVFGRRSKELRWS